MVKMNIIYADDMWYLHVFLLFLSLLARKVNSSNIQRQILSICSQDALHTITYI
jgi:hypothetical protein